MKTQRGRNRHLASQRTQKLLQRAQDQRLQQATQSRTHRAHNGLFESPRHGEIRLKITTFNEARTTHGKIQKHWYA